MNHFTKNLYFVLSLGATVQHFHAHARQHCCIACSWSYCRGAAGKHFECKFISFLFFFVLNRCSLFKMLALKALTLLLLDEDKNQKTSSKKARKYWVRSWLGNRQLFGCYYSLFQEIKRNAKAFKEFIRIKESQFEYLVEALAPMILKGDTNMRKCIKPHEMVCLALRYLTSGLSDCLNSIFPSERKLYLY